MITPIDLENKEFKKSFRGYDIDEVETFLTELSKDYAKNYRENASLKDKNAILNDAVENYKEMEETMRSAIISAQRTSEEILRNAHEQADVIVKEAKIRASEILNEAEKDIQNLKRETSEIEGRNMLLRAKLRTVLNTYIGMLDEIPTADEEVSEIKEVKKVDTDTKVVATETVRVDINNKLDDEAE